mmetsp:Transcript_27556/g.84515  ORF Transcript_27556/g.84515 Transcript_27556/m.84515 type:complete len:277 (-) Transcript_27556:427-1257(-)
MGKKVRPQGTTVVKRKHSAKESAKASRSERPRTDMTPALDCTSWSFGLIKSTGLSLAAATIFCNSGTIGQPTVDWGHKTTKTSSWSSTSSESSETAPKRTYFCSKSSACPSPQSIASSNLRTPFKEIGKPWKLPVPIGFCTATRTLSPRSLIIADVMDRVSSSNVPTRYVSSESSNSGGLMQIEKREPLVSRSASTTAALAALYKYCRVAREAGTLFSHRFRATGGTSPSLSNAASRGNLSAHAASTSLSRTSSRPFRVVGHGTVSVDSSRRGLPK